MFTRISSLALALVVSGCGHGESNGPASVPAEDNAAASTAAMVAPPKTYCAVEGARDFERLCDREMIKGANGPLLVLRNPSGGFRRLQVTTDGRGVIAADGAEPAIVTTIGTHMIEVSISEDRYRLPAIVEP